MKVNIGTANLPLGALISISSIDAGSGGIFRNSGSVAPMVKYPIRPCYHDACLSGKSPRTTFQSLDFKNQFDLGFEFDNIAKDASIATLMEQIPRLIYAHDERISFGELFAKTCNTSPASADIYRDAIWKLLEGKVIEAISVDGVQRRSGQQVKALIKFYLLDKEDCSFLGNK